MLATLALAPCCLSANDGPARLLSGINQATVLLVLVPFAIVVLGGLWLVRLARGSAEPVATPYR